MKNSVIVFGYGFAGTTNLSLLLEAYTKQLNIADSALKIVVHIIEPKIAQESFPHYEKLHSLKEKYPTAAFYTYDSEDAFYERFGTNFSDTLAVLICCNTKFHFGVISRLMPHIKGDKKPQLLIEKPLAQSLEEIKQLKTMFEEAKITPRIFYQYRYSRAIILFIKYLQRQASTIETVEIVAQKDREKKGPDRPSAGIVMDEFTHYDNLLRYMLKLLDASIQEIKIIRASITQSMKVVGNSKELQMQEYPNETPDAELEANLVLKLSQSEKPAFCNFPDVTVFLSFLQGPQKRSITFTDNQNQQFTLFFDTRDGKTPNNDFDFFRHKKNDHVEKEEAVKGNKKLTACEYFISDQKDDKNTTLEEIEKSCEFLKALKSKSAYYNKLSK